MHLYTLVQGSSFKLLDLSLVDEIMNIKLDISHPLALIFTFFTLVGSDINPVAAFSISNGSFESGSNPNSLITVTSPDTSSISNWSVTNGDIDYIGTFWAASQGSRSIDLNGLSGAGKLSTTITINPNEVGKLQTVLFDLAVNGVGTKQVQVGVSGFTTGTYSITSTSATPGTAGNNWTTNAYRFTPTSAGTLTLEFASLASGSFGAALDNVRSAFSVANGSFESGINPGINTPISSPNSSSITDWAVTAGDIDYIGSLWTASDGTRSIDLNGSTTSGTLSTTSIVFSPDEIGVSQTILFDLAVNGTGTKDVQVSISGASSVNYSINSTTSNPGTSGNLWTTKSYTFTPVTTAPVTLEFTSLSTGSFGPALDNVRNSKEPTLGIVVNAQPVPFNFEVSPFSLIGLLVVYLYKSEILAKK